MRKHLLISAAAIVAMGAGALPAEAKSNDSHRRHDVVTVKLRDNCDPATFNAFLGPDACVAHGTRPTVTLAEFFAKLNPVDFGHPQWANVPSHIELDSNESIKVVVRGGEGHTFTELPAFGPGCVAPLNDALGLTTGVPTPAQCGQYFATTSVPVGGSLTVSNLAPGTHLFECVIHPWMRTTVVVEADD